MPRTWQTEFRERMADFVARVHGDGLPVSLKVRIESGCFHSEHSPQAYRLMNEYLQTAKADTPYEIVLHESGPEILTYVAFATAGLAFTTGIINLVAAIITARAEGIKKGDRPSEPLELIVRGFWRDGKYFEEKILRIPHDQVVNAKLIADALRERTPHPKPKVTKPAKRKWAKK